MYAPEARAVSRALLAGHRANLFRRIHSALASQPGCLARTATLPERSHLVWLAQRGHPVPQLRDALAGLRHYNLVRIHSSLRVTPGMAAGGHGSGVGIG